MRRWWRRETESAPEPPTERRRVSRPPPEAEQMYAWGHAVMRLAEHLEELVVEVRENRRDG